MVSLYEVRRCPLCFYPFEFWHATGEKFLVLHYEEETYKLESSIYLGRKTHYYIFHKDCILSFRASCKRMHVAYPTFEELWRMGMLFQKPSQGFVRQSTAEKRAQDAFVNSLPYLSADLLIAKSLQLSRELLTIISQYAWPCNGHAEYTILGSTMESLNAIRSLPMEEKDAWISCTQPIYIHRTKIAAKWYIARCSNAPFLGGMESLRPPSSISRILTTWDDVGLCEIEFIESTQDSKPVDTSENIWFCSHSRADRRPIKYFCLTMQSIVRKVKLADKDVCQYWNTSDPPSLLPENTLTTNRYGNVEVNKDYRPVYVQAMIYLPLNDKLRGLSVCFSHGTILKIFTHHSFDMMQLHLMYETVAKDFGIGLIWKFFPMNPGERVTGIWVRKYHDSTCLEICTNLGRFCTFGPHIFENDRGRFKFLTLQGDISRPLAGIVFDRVGITAYKTGICVAAVVEPKVNPVPCLKHPALDEPHEPKMRAGSTMNWYLSSVPAGIPDYIKTCSETVGDKLHYLGLLMHSMGECYVLGQWRFDKTISERFVSPVGMSFVQKYDGAIYSIQDLDFLGQGVECETSSTETSKTLVDFRSHGFNWWYGHTGNILDIPGNLPLGSGSDYTTLPLTQ